VFMGWASPEVRLAIVPEMLTDGRLCKADTPKLWTKSRQRARGSVELR
jgi:hypothetical protein